MFFFKSMLNNEKKNKQKKYQLALTFQTHDLSY